jgi:hypothetical protein
MGRRPDTGSYWVKETCKCFGWDYILLVLNYQHSFSWVAWGPHRNEILEGTMIPDEWYIGPRIGIADFHEK